MLNDIPRATAAYSRALALDPNSPTALNARGLSEIASLFAKAKAFWDGFGS